LRRLHQTGMLPEGNMTLTGNWMWPDLHVQFSDSLVLPLLSA
jgi:hypothetical protein